MNETAPPHDLVITPDIEEEHLARLKKREDQLNWLLDAPEARDMPKAVAGTGLLQAIGRELWQAPPGWRPRTSAIDWRTPGTTKRPSG